MDRMKWIIFALVVIAAIGGIVFLNRKSEPAFSGDASKIITDGHIPDHSSGSLDQKVVLIEYGDFQCPACRSMHQPVKELTEKYKDKLTFIFRNYPLTNIHPNALAAAAVAEAAGQQDKFWEMHDMLYQNQEAWSSATIDQRSSFSEIYASTLGLDMTKFNKDLGSSEVHEKISRDRATGNDFKITSTPTFVINGKVFDTGKSTDSAALTAAVEEALKAAYGPDALQPPAPVQ